MSRVETLGEDIWTLRLPFGLGFFRIGTRTTIIRDQEEVLLLSPGPLSHEQWEQVERLGRVTTLIAPNQMHHLFLQDAIGRYPDAKVILAPGLGEKRTDLPSEHTLPEDLRRWGLQQHLVQGTAKLEETAFFHEPSKTLILTDLAFNFSHHHHLPSRFILWLNGALGRFGPTRLFKFVFLKDEKQFGASLRTILEWDFQQIAVGHGEMLTEKARDTFVAAYRDYL